MEGFTRQETLILTKTTSSRLAYLDRVGIVSPQKYGNFKKPTVIYSWSQVLALKNISYLKRNTSSEVMKNVVLFFENNKSYVEEKNNYLVVINESVYIAKSDWSDIVSIMKVAEKEDNCNCYILIVLPSIEKTIKAIKATAKKSNLIEFKKF